MIGRLMKISYSKRQKMVRRELVVKLTMLYGNLNCKAGGKGNRRLPNHSAENFFGLTGAGGGVSGR